MTQSFHAPQTSTGLLRGIKRQDAEAWKRFVRIYGPLVHHWCRRDGMQAADAADVTQEVFRSVFNSVERFQRSSERHSFTSWLRKITRNKVIDFWRGQGRRPKGMGGSDFRERLDQLPDDETAQGGQDVSEEIRMVTNLALLVLRDEFRESSWRAFWETAVHGRISTEVAEELGMTATAVRKAKSRIMKRLREVLDEPI